MGGGFGPCPLTPLMAATQKFFLFRKEPVSQFSVDNANEGDGLSVLGVPADRLARMTATLGRVTFYFKDAGIFETFTPSEQEGILMTKVSVGAQEGKEFELIEQVMNFVARPSDRAVMRFDVLADRPDLPAAKLLAPGDVKANVATRTVSLDTGGAPDPAGRGDTTTTVIGGIDFPSIATIPVIDFNDTTLSAISVGGEVGHTHTWANSGSGGTTYDSDNNDGTPIKSLGESNNLAKDAVTIPNDASLHIRNEYEAKKDYTMYMVYAITERKIMYPIYGNQSAETAGFGNGTAEDRMYFTFNDQEGLPAFVDLNNTDFNTKATTLQDPNLDSFSSGTPAQTCYVWVIRRDVNYNIYVHDYTGDVVGFIPAVVGTPDDKDYKTDHSLIVNRIGGVQSGSLLWSGEVARFGLIDSDIGTADAGNLARQLFDRYNYDKF